jgi:hypothetical protein
VPQPTAPPRAFTRKYKVENFVESKLTMEENVSFSFSCPFLALNKNYFVVYSLPVIFCSVCNDI